LTVIGCIVAIVVAIAELPAIRHGEGVRELVGFAVIDAVVIALACLAYNAVRHDEGRHSQVTAIAVGGIAALVSCATFVAALSDHATGTRSHRTQSEGVAVRATVLDVNQVKHTARFKDVWYTSLVDVELANGDKAVVHDPLNANDATAVGQVVSILTDPVDRAYAEFPGLPQQDRYTWLIALFVCLTTASLSAASFLSARQMRRRPARRQVAAATATA
jgi:hypothetical protein